MTTIEHEILAKCAPEQAWALLSDLEAVASYNPSVRAARVLGDRRTGIGAMRSCELVPKGTVVERVTHWEEGSAVGLEVAESDWPRGPSKVLRHEHRAKCVRAPQSGFPHRRVIDCHTPQRHLDAPSFRIDRRVLGVRHDRRGSMIDELTGRGSDTPGVHD